MNNNRNNRRRGRGNRNQGGGNQSNRIDSRARGNAPQLLDKYKKLAQDAQHNGDRVQAEYYLQFADHYFRVIADNKARQDEARAKRQDERDQSDGDEDDGEQDDRRNNRRPRGRRDDRNDDRGEDQQDREQTMSRDDEDEGDNPFVRPRRGTEDRKSAPARRPRKPRNASANGDADGEQANGGMAGIDSSVLPPAIGDAGDSGDAEAAPAKPAPRRRRKTSSDSEAAEAVN